MSKLGIDIEGFGPKGRELANRLVSKRDLADQFTVVSIADSTSTVFPRNKNEILKTVVWKNSGKKLTDLKFGIRPLKKSSIFVDLTNSDYTKAREARKRAITALQEGKHFVSASKVALSYYFSEIFSNAKKMKL